MTEAARLLHEDGVTVEELAWLARLAAQRGKKPHGLWAHWIDDANERRKELSKRR